MNQEEKQENENKVDKKFAVVIGKLTAIVQGEKNLKPVRRINNDEVGALVEQLFAEERESLLAQTKESLKALLKQYHELLKSVKQKKDELEKLETAKKEEFVKAANNLFEKIENVSLIENSYVEGLEAVVKSNG